MEFCENGSLQAMNKKFGRFPEALVAQYVYQILEGLNYLHQQGIIHRDIKGSNILSTKEGCIKRKINFFSWCSHLVFDYRWIEVLIMI